MRHISSGELLECFERDGQDDLADDVVVAVDCRGRTSVDAAALAQQLTGLPVVLVASGDVAGHPLAEALDVIATDAAELDRYDEVITEHHHAAVSLAVLLRGGRTRSVAEGLVAESATYSLLQAGPDHRRWLAGRSGGSDAVDETGEVVVLERNGDELRITLNRPATHNAFSAEMRDALVDALALLVADPSLRATVDANGPSFCSGGDLGEFGTVGDPATAHLLRLRRSVGRAIDRVADRVTVVVHGHCIGAGVELPSFAAHVVARPDATFLLPEVAMGLVPGAGGTVSIPRRIGRQRTMRLALMGEPLGAEEALRWGLVDAVTSAH